MTVAEMTVLRDAAQDAYTKAIQAAAYTIASGGSNRNVIRQKLQLLRSEMEYWQTRIDVANGDNRRVKFVTPRY